MKKLFEWSVRYKAYTCLFFAGYVMLYLIPGLFIQTAYVNSSMLWQFVFLSVFMMIFQGVFFDWSALNRVKSGVRVALFSLSALVLHVIYAVAYKWFPIGDMRSWLLFFGIFLVIFVVFYTVLVVFYKVTGKYYNELLGNYQKESRKK